MATVCLAFKLTPPEYRALTLEEHAAMIGVLKQLEQKAKG